MIAFQLHSEELTITFSEKKKKMTYNCLHDIKSTREAQGILVLIDTARIILHFYV